jgi:endonuclease/exonuclease/phosphatase family metal-dependent hydrolase
MRVATWNIWNTQLGEDRWLKLVPELLRSEEADVICLQEVSRDSRGMPQSFSIAQKLNLLSESYQYAGKWKGREEGLAILSRFPITEMFRTTLSEGSDRMGRALFGVTLATDDGEIEVLTTHFSYPISDMLGRQKQAREATAFLKQRVELNPTRPRVFAGDLNDTPPSSTIKIVKEHSGFLDACAEMEAGSRWTFASSNPHVKPDLIPDRCIDYIFCSEHWTVVASHLFGRSVSGRYASDHFGVIAELELSD